MKQDVARQIGEELKAVLERLRILAKEERDKADLLLDTLDYHEITREIAKEAGRYRYEFSRQGIALSTPDTLVAATAIARGATLITANIRDFPMDDIQPVGELQTTAGLLGDLDCSLQGKPVVHGLLD